MAEWALDDFQWCLNRLSGVCFKVSLLEFFSTFQVLTKRSQVYVRRPNICALIYARNNKRGCYTGFFKKIARKDAHDSE